MIFGAPINVSTNTSAVPGASPPVSTAACNLLATQKATLYAQVAQGIFKIQNALNNGAPPDRNAAMTLAEHSRKLGRVMGQLDACQTPPLYDVAKLKQMRAANYQDLVLIELKLNEAWIDHQYPRWLLVRTAVQNYHQTVAKLDAWIVRAAATQPAVTPLVAVNASPTSAGPAQIIIDPAPSSAPTTYPAELPFYRQSKFWIGAAIFTSVGLGLVALSRT